MSLFPRAGISPYVSEPSFTPLFRLLDEFDTYNGGRRSNSNGHSTSLKSFQPKFDVKEVEDAYELHGELPGISQKDVEIEFVDQQTLSIRGRTERTYESGTPANAAGAITEAGEHGQSHSQSHKAMVEDDENEPATLPSETQVAKQSQQQQVQQQAAGPQHKYWVSERSVGEFSRAFSFPTRVDQDAVKASMKDGILSIVVPKARKVEGRKITIH